MIKDSRILRAGMLLLIFCAAAAAMAEGKVKPAPPPPWFEDVLVGMEVGPTGAQTGSDPSDVGYAARFNGGEIVERCADAGSDYVVIWARDGDYAYYNSKILPKCPGLGDRDPLREAVEAGRKRGIPIIAYCVVQQGGPYLREHPEFQMRDHDDKPIGRFCYNSGYREVMNDLLYEMLAYGIDGFHIDMIDQGFGPPYGCWCDTCRTMFKEQFGSEMPKGVTWDADWDRMLEFRYATSERFEKALRSHVHRAQPAAAVDFNYHGNPPFSWEVGQRPVQHAVNGDFITGETGVWGFSALGVGMNARFYAAATPGLRVQVAMQRGVRMYHDQTTRPLNDMRWELLTLLAHGAFVTIVDKTAYDGWLDPVAYERFGEAFKEAHAKKEHFGQSVYAEVGLYYSSRTRDWIGRESPQNYQQAFIGAHKALVYEHIPWDVLLDENTTLEKLQHFKVVMLPNADILSENEVALFRRYVEGGGNLITTGLTGIYGRLGELQKTNALGDLIGAEFVGKLESMDNHVKLGSKDLGFEAIGKSIRSDWPFLVKGPGAIYKPTTATAVGELLKPHRSVRQLKGEEGFGWPMSADSPVGPALLINNVGKGKVAALTCSPDHASASDHRVTEARLLLANLISYLNPEPQIEIKAPRHVESIVTHDAEHHRYRVHLLAYLTPPGSIPDKERPYVLPSLIEDTPLYRVSIKTRFPIKNAKARNQNTSINSGENEIKATIEDIHDVIIIDY